MLSRWGFELKDQQCLCMTDVQKINMQPYLDRLRAEKKDRKVYIVDSPMRWTEAPLSTWFLKNFGLLGLTEIIEQHTSEYNKLKKEMKFNGFPDFLGKTNNSVVKIELECFPCGYHHPEDYCEVVLCYELNTAIEHRPQKWYGLKELLGYNEIINTSEILEYMYLRYEDFRKEIRNKLMQSWIQDTE
jgi:hypothetical protein